MGNAHSIRTNRNKGWLYIHEDDDNIIILFEMSENYDDNHSCTYNETNGSRYGLTKQFGDEAMEDLADRARKSRKH